jgi:hypothetical protein
MRSRRKKVVLGVGLLLGAGLLFGLGTRFLQPVPEENERKQYQLLFQNHMFDDNREFYQQQLQDRLRQETNAQQKVNLQQVMQDLQNFPRRERPYQRPYFDQLRS